MEIADFLRITPRRLLALLVLALLIAAPVGAVLLKRPARYQATAEVRLAPLVSPTATGDEHARVLDDYGAALNTVPVVDQAAAASRLSPVAIRGGLTYHTTDVGYLVQVQWTDTSAARARLVVQTASVGALRLLAQQDVDVAVTAESAADQQVATALAPFQAFVSANGPVDRLTVLVNQELSLLRNRSLVPGQLTSPALIAEEQAAQAALVAATPQYTNLAGDLGTALTTARQAAGARATAVATLAGIGSGSFVAVDAAVAPGHLKTAAVTGFGAGAGAVLLAIIGLVVAELRRRPASGAVPVPAGPEGGRGFGRAPPAHRRRVSMVPGSRLLPGLLDRLAPGTVAVVGLVLLVPVVYLGAVIGPVLLGASKTTLALVAAVPLGVAAIALALTWFDGFLVFLLVVRSSLDTLNTNGLNQTGGVTPAVAIGGVFIVAGGLWLAAQWRSERWVKVSAVTWWLWAFALACLISVPTSVKVSGSLVSTSKVIAGVLMFSVLEQYLGRRPERAKVIIGCLLLSFVVPATLALRQWVSGHGLVTNNVDIGRVQGTFTHPSTLATYLLLVLPVAILLMLRYKGLPRLALGLVVAVSSILMLLTYTRAAWAAALLVLVYLGIRGRRQILWILLAGVVFILVAVPSVAARLADLNAKPVAAGIPSNSLAWRTGYWGRILPLVHGKYVTGIGFDGVQYVTPERLQPHNGFIQTYVETGVVGFVAMMGIIGSLAMALRRRLRDAAPGWERVLALAAVAAAIGLLVQFPSENLLSETIVWWYAAAAMTYGLRSTGSGRRAGAAGSLDADPSLSGRPEDRAAGTAGGRPELVGAGT